MQNRVYVFLDESSLCIDIYIYIGIQTFQPLMEKQPFIQKHRKRLCISTGIKREDQLDMIPVIPAWSLGQQIFTG